MTMVRDKVFHAQHLLYVRAKADCMKLCMYVYWIQFSCSMHSISMLELEKPLITATIVLIPKAVNNHKECHE